MARPRAVVSRGSGDSEMERTERFYRLHRLLSGRVPVSLERMQEELQASRATVFRDLAYLRDFFQAPIVYDPDLGYRYDPNAPQFELPGLWFNASELYALLAIEQLLEGVDKGFLAPRLAQLKGRIRRLLGSGGAHADRIAEKVRLIAVGRRSMDEALFGCVAQAIVGERPLEILYYGRGRGQRSERTVHPQRLLHYRDNWYLAAWCEQAQDLRIFSMDRIERVGEAPVAWRPVDEAVLERFLGASFGIFSGEARGWAVLRFSAERARWVADEQWHPDQVGHHTADGYELQVPYSDPRELLMDILKYGPDVEVLAPPELRELVAQRLAEAAARYAPDQ